MRETYCLVFFSHFSTLFYRFPHGGNFFHVEKRKKTWQKVEIDKIQEFTGKHVFSRIFRNVPDTFEQKECSRGLIILLSVSCPCSINITN